MEGWKPAERIIDGPVLLDQAVARAEELGFEVAVRNPGHVILKREGTQFTLRGERFPLELAIAESESGVYVQLRYDTFVLGDTGDLEAYADEVAAALAGADASSG